MSEITTCPTCKGNGYFESLVSQHDDKKETVKCKHVMVKELSIK